MKSWKTLSKTTVLNHSKYLSVENHTIQLPNGQVIEAWPWLVLPDYVNVLALTEQGHFLCFRQTKYGVDGLSLAPVGGYVEPDEAPLTAAQRELLEETGYQASDWIDLGQYPVDGNRGAGTAHLFLALGARPVTTPQADDLEEQALIQLTESDLKTALRNGQFKVLSWTTIVALALLYLEHER